MAFSNSSLDIILAFLLEFSEGCKSLSVVLRFWGFDGVMETLESTTLVLDTRFLSFFGGKVKSEVSVGEAKAGETLIAVGDGLPTL